MNKIRAVTLVALSYFLAARLGLLLAFEKTNASPVWPPSGLALAAVLIWGPGVWPGIFLGALLANATVFVENQAGSLALVLLLSALIALGNSLEALAAWALARRLGAAETYSASARGALLMALSAFAACLLSPCLGPTAMAFSGLIPWSLYPRVWFTWWLGDSIGMLVLAPFLLAWRRRPRIIFRSRRFAEFLILLLLLTGACLVIFHGWLLPPHSHYPLAVICLPFFVWSSFRFTLRELSTAILLSSVLAVSGTVAGHGPFGMADVNLSLLLLQGFLGVVTVTMLATSGVVTERRRAQRELSLARDGLEDKVRERTAQLLEAERIARLGSWRWDLSGDQVDLSEEMAKLMGLEGERRRLSYDAFLDLVHPADRALADDSLQTALRGKGPVAFDHRTTGGGEERWLHVRAVVARDASGYPFRMVGAVQDVTDLRRIEELKRAKEGAEEMNRAKSRLLAVVSHEMRTPLNSILGFTRILKESPPSPDRAESLGFLDRIEDSGRRLLALINDFLDLARLEAGKISLFRTEVDLAPLLTSLAAEFADKIGSRGLSLSLEIPEGLEPCSSDPEKVRQILANLIDNALKFTEKGGVVLRVLRRPGRGRPSRVEVEDSGPGLPPGREEKIFEAFEQGDSGVGRRFGGTGLGLAICKGLAESMGFRVSARNKPAGGAVFSLVLEPGDLAP